MKKLTPASYAATVKQNIKNHGCHMTFVGASETPCFCYSTGILESFGIPELIISSLSPAMSGQLIKSYVNRFTDAAIPIGERIKKQEEDPFDYFLIRVDLNKVNDYVLASRKYYGATHFEYLQLIFPDTCMRFPHDAEYDYDQEIFGDYSAIKQSS